MLSLDKSVRYVDSESIGCGKKVKWQKRRSMPYLPHIIREYHINRVEWWQHQHGTASSDRQLTQDNTHLYAHLHALNHILSHLTQSIKLRSHSHLGLHFAHLERRTAWHTAPVHVKQNTWWYILPVKHQRRHYRQYNSTHIRSPQIVVRLVEISRSRLCLPCTAWSAHGTHRIVGSPN